MRWTQNKFLFRMVMSYTTVFGLILATIFTLLQFILVANAEKENRLNHQIMVQQPLSQMERFIVEMDNVAYQGMTNQNLISIFSVLKKDDDYANHFKYDVMDDIDTASVLKGINRGVAPVWRLSAYNGMGDFISSGATVNLGIVKDVLGLRQADRLMQEFTDDYVGGIIDYKLYPPQQDPWSGWYESKYISLIRPVMNIYSGDVVGIVEVQQSLNDLEKYVKMDAATGYAVNVYDQYGNCILQQGTERHVAVARVTSEECGWTVELFGPVAAKQAIKNSFALILIVLWGSLTFVMAFVIAIIARQISKPLTILTDKVRDINISDPQQIPLVKTKIEEIIALQTGFNQVLNSLTFSIGQEKKAFMLAMQAQMNPHFLYNVLSVINAVAMEGDFEAVMSICVNLSGMLRYLSSFEKSTATIKEELEHTTEYLELMKARYRDMFEYTTHVDLGLEDMVIPKLVIQPMCENVFTHSFANMEPPYILNICVCHEEGGYSISVQDNGTGFEPETMRQVMEKVRQTTYEDINRLQLGGLGLASSVVRLKLVTKKEVLCDINSTATAGAIVKLSVLDKQEDGGK